MGAWIEIGLSAPVVLVTIVAPLVGAWIEITFPLSVCGPERVAPLVGAWIEIAPTEDQEQYDPPSLPSWERGLKLLQKVFDGYSEVSLLSWERGLK